MNVTILLSYLTINGVLSVWTHLLWKSLISPQISNLCYTVHFFLDIQCCLFLSALISLWAFWSWWSFFSHHLPLALRIILHGVWGVGQMWRFKTRRLVLSIISFPSYHTETKSLGIYYTCLCHRVRQHFKLDVTEKL